MITLLTLLITIKLCYCDDQSKEYDQHGKLHFDATRSLSGSSTYAQVGQTITGDSVNDELGYNQVYISDDGLMIAYSSTPSQYVYVMEYDGGSWVQKGSKIEYTSGDIQLGRGMAFSGDGLTIAVGANKYTNNLTNQGGIFIYMFDGTDWVLHTTVTGLSANDRAGESLKLSGDGFTLLYLSSIWSVTDQVSVLKLTNNVWTQVGSTLMKQFDFFGIGLAVNYDGSVIALSGSYYAQVYELQANDWVQKGSTLTTNNSDERHRVDLSDDGSMLVVGSVSASRVDVYKYENNDWGTIYTSSDIAIQGPSNQYFGFVVKMSSDGSLILIGSPLADVVSVYGMTGCGWYPVLTINDSTGNSGSLFGQVLDMTSDGSRVIVSASYASDTRGEVRVFDIDPIVECPQPSMMPIISLLPSVSKSPSFGPSLSPTIVSSQLPTSYPSSFRSSFPTYVPSFDPTLLPSKLPSYGPSLEPSFVPSFHPTLRPSMIPSNVPSILPSMSQSVEPSFHPTLLLSKLPSNVPSVEPSLLSSITPTSVPSMIPTYTPSLQPLMSQSFVPSFHPTSKSSTAPTNVPSMQPTILPSIVPTSIPSILPSFVSSMQPSVRLPTLSSSFYPSLVVTTFETPSMLPSVALSGVPSTKRSTSPTLEHSVLPTFAPSSLVSHRLTMSPSYFHDLVPSTMSSSPTLKHSSLLPTLEQSSLLPYSPSSIPTKITPVLTIIPSLSTQPSSRQSSHNLVMNTASVTIDIDDCVNRDLNGTELSEMEDILFEFVKESLLGQNITMLDISINAQSQARILQDENDEQNNYRSLQSLQLVSRRLDVSGRAMCETSYDFQASFEGSFENTDRNIELLRSLKSSNILNLYFKYASLVIFTKQVSFDYLPSSSPSTNRTSATPINDGTNSGTIGAAALAGVGAAAAAGSAAAASAAAAAGGGGGGREGDDSVMIALEVEICEQETIQKRNCSKTVSKSDAMAEATKEMRARNMKKATRVHAAKGKRQGAAIKAKTKAQANASSTKNMKCCTFEFRPIVQTVIFAIKMEAQVLALLRPQHLLLRDPHQQRQQLAVEENVMIA